jgi:F-type H+-transporting ATPase subunit gamma
MASVKDLRDRIKSLKSTQQITKAMKQVAAAKIRRAELAQRQARPYAEGLFAMLRDLMNAVGSVEHPFLKPGRDGAPKGIILMTSDKGLAGAFNSNIVRQGEQLAGADGNLVWYAVGVKARNATKRMSQPTVFETALSAAPKIETARRIAARVSDDFVSGTISEITLVSSKLVSMSTQRPESRTLVPVVADKAQATGGPRGAVEFSPSPEAVLTRLLPKYLEFTIFSAMLETDAAFFAAQLIAMNNATENASKLIDELTIQMNNARQAAITKELLEIVAGAEALGA